MGFGYKRTDTPAPASDDSGSTTTTTVIVQEPSDGSITSDKLADGSVTANKIADESITSDKLADESISSKKLLNGSVTSEKIADGSITADKLSGVDLSTASVEDGSITSDKIADGSVASKKLANSAVTASKIASNAVTNTKIKNGEVTFAKLASAVQDRITALENHNRFPASPQKIGVWINEMPVWRIAFEEVWDDYDQAMRDGYVSVLTLANAVENISEIYAVINAYAIASPVQEDEYENISLNPNTADNIPLHVSYSSPLPGFSFDLTSVKPINERRINSGLAGSALHGMLGWIDFVTPESNIVI